MEEVTIGSARLIRGDAREIVTALADRSIGFIFTDPPYGNNNNNNGDLIERREKALGCPGKEPAKPRPIANDGPEANDLARWFFGEANRLLAKGGCCCCCGGGGGPDPQFARWSLWMDEAIGFKQMVIWDKGPMGMGWHYRRSYEAVLVGQKRGARASWFDQSRRIENIIRPGDYGIRKIIPRADEHPTPKPPELATHFIGLHSLPCETVLDPFMGAGSTGVACAQLGRPFIGVEIEPRWFDLACRRIEAAQSAALAA
jgi:site-specific DNA-methyltransferase (adenine-specific)